MPLQFFIVPSGVLVVHLLQAACCFLSESQHCGGLWLHRLNSCNCLRLSLDLVLACSPTAASLVELFSVVIGAELLRPNVPSCGSSSAVCCSAVRRPAISVPTMAPPRLSFGSSPGGVLPFVFEGSSPGGGVFPLYCSHLFAVLHVAVKGTINRSIWDRNRTRPGQLDGRQCAGFQAVPERRASAPDR